MSQTLQLRQWSKVIFFCDETRVTLFDNDNRVCVEKTRSQAFGGIRVTHWRGIKVDAKTDLVVIHRQNRGLTWEKYVNDIYC